MKNKATSFFLILSVSSLAFVLASSLAAFFFRVEGRDIGQVVLASSIAGAAFIIVSLAVIGPFARHYRFNFRACADGADCGGHEDYEAALRSVGSSPLLGLIIFFVLAIAYAAGLGLIANAPGLEGRLRIDFSLFVLSLGMLAASFLYVISDRLTLTSLLECRLAHYPSRLRENRQQRKIFIIPLFMALMSLLFAFATAFLLRSREGMEGFAVLPALFGLSGSFFVVVLCLMLSWNSNTALLYRSIIAQLEGLTQAEKNLTGRIDVCSVDELGSIAGMVNAFCDGLAGGIRKVASIHHDLAAVQARLHDSIGGASGAAADITRSVAGALASIEKADTSLAESLGDARRLASHVADVATKAREQSERVASSSAGVESVMASVGRLSRDADTALTTTGELGTQVRAGEADVRAVVENVNAVAARSADLGEINKLIAAVASRTNLLAMNAAIEAAHAGSAGKGFSVVAEEIRTLAESTAQHTRKSKESLGAILDLIRKSLESAESAGASFGRVRDSAVAVERVTAEVAKAMREEEGRSKEILRLLSETDELGRGVAETTRALDEVAAGMAERLQAASTSQAEAKSLAAAMRERNGQLAGAMDEVTSLSSRTSELNETLAGFISSFKA